MKQVYRKRFKKGASTVTGSCFTISWERFKAHLEQRNKGRLGNVVSVRVDEGGLTVFSEDGDCSAWAPAL